MERLPWGRKRRGPAPLVVSSGVWDSMLALRKPIDYYIKKSA